MSTRSAEPTPWAAAAKMIRHDLKRAFPTVTFKVRSDSYSGGCSIDIHWTDGPTTDQVERLTGRYQHGRFDGMQDLYEYSNSRKDIPQADYVHTTRNHSDAVTAAAVAFVNRAWGWNLAYEPNQYGRMAITNDGLRGNCSGWQSQDVYRTLYSLSLICPIGHATLPGDAYCPDCGHDLHPIDDEETNVSLAAVDWESTVNTM